MQNIDVFNLIERMVALIRSEERKRCTEMGLQPVHLQVLDYLSRCNRFSDTPAALTSYLGMTRGTVSQTVLLMVKKGLINKVQDTNDKRMVHLQLSDQGKEVLEQAKPSRLFGKAFSILPQSDFAKYETVFVNTLTALQKANESKSFGLCKTCKYFTVTEQGFVCGLTREKLSKADSEKICQEHTPD